MQRMMRGPGHEMERRHLRIGGRDLAYTDVGRGAPVVLIHGTLTTLEDMMWTLGEPLAERYRVIAFDRPGFGRSDVRRWTDAGIYRQAASLLDAIATLDLHRPLLVGHSLGASIALAMAAEARDRIRGVVALAPLVLPEFRLEPLLFGARALPVTGAMLSQAAHMTSDLAMLPVLWRAMFVPQTLPERIAQAYPFALADRADALVRVGEDALAAGPDLVRLLATSRSCRVPVRILGGDRDAVVDNGRNGQMLATLMLEATYMNLPGLGHMIHHFACGEILEAIETLPNL